MLGVASINANDKPPRPYHDLNAAGLAEHHRLAEELLGGWFHPTGDLRWVTADEQRTALRQKVARLHEWGYRSDLVDRARAHDLAPELVLPPAGEADYTFSPDDGWVAVPVLVRRLLAAAEGAGATVLFPVPVERLQAEAGRVTGVVAAGRTVQADLVIDCRGRFAGERLAPLGLGIDRLPSPGLLVVTEPAPIMLGRVVHTPRLYLRPDGGGRVLMGASDVDATLRDLPPATARLELDSPQAQELLRRGQAVLPWLAGVRLEAARVGWRPMPADGLSAIGPVPGVTGYYLVFTHSGVTLGPLLGRLVAEEVTTGQPQPLLAPFRPDRLTRIED